MESFGADIEMADTERRGRWEDKVGTIEFLGGQIREKIIEKGLRLVSTEEYVDLGWWAWGYWCWYPGQVSCSGLIMINSGGFLLLHILLKKSKH